MPNNTATEKTGSAEHRDNTIARGCHDGSIPTSLTIGRALQPMEYPVDLARHDKIVLVQPFDLLGAQRNGCVTPAEADIGVVPFGFSQLTDVANKAERFSKIAEVEGSFDTMAVIVQFPIRSLRSKVLRFREREPRNTAATRSAFFLGEGLGHVRTFGCHRKAKGNSYRPPF